MAQDRDHDRRPIGDAYPYGQLVRAFLTALTHDDAATRASAEGRVDRWRAVLRGMASGDIRVGSRAPVADLPAWATAEVLRGGFATGRARAAGTGGDLAQDFERALTEPGLGGLHNAVLRGDYAILVPEHAALPVVAWLIGVGDRDGARRLVETVAPYADRLVFQPVPGARAIPVPGPRTAPSGEPVVWRASAGQVRDQLAAPRPRPRLSAQREALLVWNPFADEVLAHWLRHDHADDDAWRAEARALLERYDQLAATHTRCTKHRRPKENLAILLAALRDAATGDRTPPDPRRAGLLQTAIDAMVARRGAPGSPEHTRLRERQAAKAGAPARHATAAVAARRLDALPPDEGLSPEQLSAAMAPLSPAEAETYNNARDAVRDGGALAPATPIPHHVARVIRRTHASTVEQLVAMGVVPSAEVLAELVPAVAAKAVAAAYADAPLRALMAKHYLAFRRRRSVLLVDLQHQVRLDELPWVAAVAPHRREDTTAAEHARRTLVDIAGLTLRAFPATLVPSALITELEALAAEAGVPLRLVPELAADIFNGRLTPRFLTAAQRAGARLRGTLYANYYAIDYMAIARIDDLAPAYPDQPQSPRTSPTFDALCRARAGQDTQPGFPGVSGRGAIIEQAQILTTQNLAALTDRRELGGRAPELDHAALARRAFAHAGVLGTELRDDSRSLRVVKNLAYAWRQAVFFASLARNPEGVVRDAAQGAELLTPAYEELLRAARGKDVDPARRVLGWAPDGEHWLLTAAERRRRAT